MSSNLLDAVDFDSASGAEAAEEASARTSFARNNFLKVEDRQEVIIRLLSDVGKDLSPSGLRPWLTVKQHGSVPTKPRPKSWPKAQKWPASMSAICRNDKLWKSKGPGLPDIFESCWICDNVKDEKDSAKAHKAPSRTWAIAVLREEITEGRRVVGSKNKMTEIELEGGKKIWVPEVVIINLSHYNFFGQIQGMAGRWDTVLDLDLIITRKGTGQETKYAIAPGKQDEEDYRDPAVMDKFFPEEIRKLIVPDLRQLVIDRVDDEYYEKFFIPTAKDDEEPEDAEDKGGPAAPDNDLPDEQNSEEYQSLVDRVQAKASNRRPRSYSDED